jgi:hypothetical protein
VSRRVLVSIALAVLSLGASACATSASKMPPCTRPDDRTLILIAQAVPSATKLPCIESLPVGWTFGGSLVETDLARMWLDSDVGGIHAVQVDLVARCDTAEAVEIPPGPGEGGTKVFQQPVSLPPNYVATRFVVFPGGCLRTRYRFAADAPAALAIEADAAVGLIARATVVAEVEDAFGLSLCGVNAPPCEGEQG